VGIDHVDLRRVYVGLSRHFVKRLNGQTVLALDRRAKYIVGTLSSGETC
jgi:formamidopyrimidine-DNA glycosylase